MPGNSTTSDDILTCARSLIVTGGYNGFSYADIARVVGIRKASIHHHFPAKADLVRVLVARYREEAQKGLEAIGHHRSDPVDQLRAYTAYWESCIADATAPICVCALLASEIPVLPKEVVAEVKAHFRGLSAWLADVLARGARAGRFRLAAPPEAEAELFMATVHGAMLSARAYDEPAVFGRALAPLLGRLASKD